MLPLAKHLQDRPANAEQRQSIVYREEENSEISTKVTPVSRPEAAGWSVVILAAYGVSAFLLYLVYSQFFVETPETVVFNRALDTVREDFRVSAVLGSTIKGAQPVPVDSSDLLKRDFQKAGQTIHLQICIAYPYPVWEP